VTFILFNRRFDRKVVLSVVNVELPGIGYLETIGKIFALQYIDIEKAVDEEVELVGKNLTET
jgi:hypothetical protein